MAVDKTFVLKGTPVNDWVLVDAQDQGLGRLATQVARYLLGKHKPTYTPGVEMGDFVVVINVSRLNITKERAVTKFYHKHSGYPGGLKSVSLKDQMIRHPDRALRDAVWGMLPHNKVGRRLIKKLRIFPGSEHTHAAQKPVPVA
jgi:large subunit ribosomal protein L13